MTEISASFGVSSIMREIRSIAVTLSVVFGRILLERCCCAILARLSSSLALISIDSVFRELTDIARIMRDVIGLIT